MAIRPCPAQSQISSALSCIAAAPATGAPYVTRPTTSSFPDRNHQNKTPRKSARRLCFCHPVGIYSNQPQIQNTTNVAPAFAGKIPKQDREPPTPCHPAGILSSNPMHRGTRCGCPNLTAPQQGPASRLEIIKTKRPQISRRYHNSK